MSTDKPTGVDTYNATIERIETVADGLSIFFIRPDTPIPGRLPGPLDVGAWWGGGGGGSFPNRLAIHDCHH